MALSPNTVGGLVTFSHKMLLHLKDFPEAMLDQFDIFPRHPDDFILDLADLEPAIVTTAVKYQRASLKNPPYEPYDFIERLRRQGLPGLAAFLETEIDLI